MRRSKAAVSVEVRQVIGDLCRLLAATGLDAVPAPETFRRAKFGGGLEVEDEFWRLLTSILQSAGIVSCEALNQLEGVSKHRKLVAAGLWQTGYHADWVCCGEGGEGGQGGRFSSRDLLLALGWLLATGTLEKLLTRRVQQMDNILLTPIPVNPPPSSELQLHSASLRKLQWLTGSLKHQGRTLLSMQEERTRLLHAECVCVRQLCDLLEAYLNWKQVENVFWTWMDSVVDCHLTDPVVEKPTHAPSGSTRVCHHGNRGLEKFEDMILRLPRGQKGQRRGRGDAEDRDRLQGGLDTSSLPPLLSSLPSLPTVPQVYRAKLQTVKPVKRGCHPAEVPHSWAETPDELPSSQATQLLLHAEALLLERRDRQRLANRILLQEMVGKLDELVLIPP
ncbi:protein C14orf80-like protein [Nibea albiflora]|uniref:Protein C14orf80-like protein n=1 Tax=Nibea albiflora TaxID=240163 RepID=A0ACB7FH23_NIBAL|nr:protein C14orf80-like protein [Nibea albiflora]